ncbi:hypothetical protein MRX96_045298 [Rhipicephalus microplus]
MSCCDRAGYRHGRHSAYSDFLIDPLSSKTTANRNFSKVLCTYMGDGHKLLKGLTKKYLIIERGEYPTPEGHEGPENKEPDRPFTTTKLWSAIEESNRRDAITFKLLET